MLLALDSEQSNTCYRKEHTHTLSFILFVGKMSREDASLHILKKVVLDGFLLCGLIICIYATTLWTPFNRGFFCVDESLMFPYKDDTVTVPMLRGVGLALPYIAIIICEWALLRKEQSSHSFFGISVPRWLQGVYCAALAFSFGLCFAELTSNIAKKMIGRLRPHFFDVCQPSIDCSSPEWQGRYIQSFEYECTGDRLHLLHDMRQSFLSGHSCWSAFTMVFLALYLEKRMVWSCTRTLRHCLQFGAVMLSWITALSRVSDFKHHWSDVLAGYSMGVVVAALMWMYGTDLIQKKKKHCPVPQHDLPLPNASHCVTISH